MTEIVRAMDKDSLDGLFQGVPDSEWKTQDQGAATLIVAGFDPSLDGTSSPLLLPSPRPITGFSGILNGINN